MLHTHTRAGAGISLLDRGLRPISQDALHVLDDVAYHPYGVPATVEECEALGRTCAHGSCVVLLNHGLLTFGQTIHGALMRLYMLERACELELIARTMDAPPVMIEPLRDPEGGRADAEDPQHRRLWPDGMEGPGPHGGAQRRRLPPVGPFRKETPPPLEGYGCNTSAERIHLAARNLCESIRFLRQTAAVAACDHPVASRVRPAHLRPPTRRRM